LTSESNTDATVDVKVTLTCLAVGVGWLAVGVGWKPMQKRLRGFAIQIA
jgi:hypothetical protein